MAFRFKHSPLNFVFMGRDGGHTFSSDVNVFTRGDAHAEFFGTAHQGIT